MTTQGDATRGRGPGGSSHALRKELPSLDSTSSRRTDGRIMRRIAGTFRPYWRHAVVVSLAIALVSVLGVVNPIMLKLAISVAFPRGDLGLLAFFVSVMVATPIIGSFIGVGQSYLSAVVGQRVMRDLRNRLYAHLQRMPLRFFTNTRTGEIQSRLSNDIAGIQTAVTQIGTSTVANITIAVSTIAGMLVLSPPLTLLSLGLLPVFLWLAYRVSITNRHLTKSTHTSLADLSVIVEETLSVSGVLLTKTFGRQKREIERFRQENERLTTLQIRQEMAGRWFVAFMSMFFSVTPALIYLLQGYLAFGPGRPHADSKQTAEIIGTLVAFTTLQSRLFFPIGQLLTVQVEMQGTLALFERIFEYLDMPCEIADSPTAVALSPATVRGDVALDHVTFHYSADQEQPTIDDISFVVKPGQLVALVGPSGAGKTTITYLVSRLYDVQEGVVSIDGHSVGSVTLESLGEVIGVVTQETYLFHATVRENLRYARSEATDAELEEAARAAAIHERIMELPEGYDTMVGEHGYKLSGGEKQRIAIARVILKDPRILILDEATSALDTGSERLIQSALETVMRNRTTIAIAHRLSTILAADVILVMNGGHIVERGTHAELLDLGGLYARLYREQFSANREAPCTDGACLALANGATEDMMGEGSHVLAAG